MAVEHVQEGEASPLGGERGEIIVSLQSVRTYIEEFRAATDDVTRFHQLSVVAFNARDDEQHDRVHAEWERAMKAVNRAACIIAWEVLAQVNRANELPSSDAEDVPFVFCDDCGRTTLDDNTDVCANPQCRTNALMREAVEMLSTDATERNSAPSSENAHAL